MKKLFFIPLLFLLCTAVAQKRKSVDIHGTRVIAKDSMCLNGDCIHVWPTGGGGGGGGDSAWRPTGNNGITGTAKLGTLDNKAVNIIANNKLLLQVNTDSTVKVNTRIPGTDSTKQAATTEWIKLNIEKYITSSDNSVLLTSIGKVINFKVNPDSFLNTRQVTTYITNIINGPTGAWLLNGNTGTDTAFHGIGTKDPAPVKFISNSKNIFWFDQDSIYSNKQLVLGLGAGSGTRYNSVGLKILAKNNGVYQSLTIGTDANGSGAAVFSHTNGIYNFSAGPGNATELGIGGDAAIRGVLSLSLYSNVWTRIYNAVYSSTGNYFTVDERTPYLAGYKTRFNITHDNRIAMGDSVPPVLPNASVNIFGNKSTSLYVQNNVGIGDSLPTEKLVVKGGITCDSLKIGNTWYFDKKITLTPSQINSLQSSPVMVIPAPGSGKSIELISSSAFFIYNSIAYATATNIYISFFGFSNCQNIASFPFGTASTHSEMFLQNDFPSSSKINTPVYISTEDDNADGNSNLIISMHYRVITL